MLSNHFSWKKNRTLPSFNGLTLVQASTSLSLINQNLEKIPEIKGLKVSVITRLDLSQNPIKTFEGLTSNYTISHIVLDHTKLMSFVGIESQLYLTSISALRTPIGGNPCFPVMAVILFGDSMETVNGRYISAKKRKLADKLRKYIIDDLVEGWVLTGVNPVILMDPVTRKRKTVVVNMKPVPTSEEEEEEEEENEEEEKKENNKDKDEKMRNEFDDLRSKFNQQCLTKSNVKGQKRKPSLEPTRAQFMRTKAVTASYPFKTPPF